VGSAILVRRLELVTDIAVRGQRQPLFRHCRAADVAAQPFQLLAFMGLSRYPGMQRKPGYLPYPVIERLVARR
jgi:hypothetical protein